MRSFAAVLSLAAATAVMANLDLTAPVHDEVSVTSQDYLSQ